MKKTLAILTLLMVFCAKPEAPERGPMTAAAPRSDTRAGTDTVGTSSNDSQGEQGKLGHFKLWRVSTSQVVSEIVTLQRSGEPSWNARVDRIEYLANPATKTHRQVPHGITNAALHYVAYELQPVDHTTPTLKAWTFKNQLTLPNSATWQETLTDEPWLLVPASKTPQQPPPDPPPGDHFICFVVKPAPHPEDTVTVTDQFYKDGAPKPPLTLTPARICTPVQKTREGHPAASLLDRNAILAIYRFDSSESYPDPVYTRDQFATPEKPDQKLTIRRSEFLAVPREPESPQ